jgi:hypothetical protein
MALDQDEIIYTLEKQVEDLQALLDCCPEAKQLLEQSTESPTKEEKCSVSAADSNTFGTRLLKRKRSADDGGSESSPKNRGADNFTP